MQPILMPTGSIVLRQRSDYDHWVAIDVDGKRIDSFAGPRDVQLTYYRHCGYRVAVDETTLYEPPKFNEPLEFSEPLE